MRMELCCGIDIGNAKTEVAFMSNGEMKFVRQPSVVTYLTSKPDANDSDEATVMSQLFENLTVQTFSQGLKQDGLYFVGTKALSSADGIRNMPIHSGQKSEHDIPLLASFSILSGIGIDEYYKANKQLPKSLHMKVKMATAIPSSEYTKDIARRLEVRFLGEHNVNMFVGESTVLVTLEITHCKVTEEGKTAMLAFLNSDASILAHYNETYATNLTPADFSKAKSLHADIGDGTSEIVYTNGFNPVAGGSRGLRVGVGHATQNAIELYKKELSNSTGEITRQHFMETLNGKNDKAKIANEQMEKATIGQAVKILDKIMEGFAEVTTSSADYFFVHGGGSIVFKKNLYEDLLSFASRVSGQVVWIPAEHATTMNSKGTFYLAEFLFCKNEK